jgi:hypothetical protein
VSKLKQCIAKALECELRATNADDPGVRKAYRRAAAEWLDITEDALSLSSGTTASRIAGVVGDKAAEPKASASVTES